MVSERGGRASSILVDGQGEGFITSAAHHRSPVAVSSVSLWFPAEAPPFVVRGGGGVSTALRCWGSVLQLDRRQWRRRRRPLTVTDVFTFKHCTSRLLQASYFSTIMSIILALNCHRGSCALCHDFRKLGRVE